MKNQIDDIVEEELPEISKDDLVIKNQINMI